MTVAAPDQNEAVKSIDVAPADVIKSSQPVVSETDGDEEAKTCRRMIATLTDDEVEHAARDSYRYLIATSSEGGDKPSKEWREELAMGLARRHLRRYKGNEEVALKRLRATIAFRKEFKVDDIRMGYYEKEPKEETTKLIEDLDEQMSTGKLYVKGVDRKNRALMRMDESRYEQWDKKVPYIQAHIYAFERALACTECRTNGEEEKIIVVCNYRAYTSKNQPPLSMAKALMGYFGLHWPEKLAKAFIVDAPLLFRVFYKILKPFIDSDTTSRVQFVTGVDEIKAVMGEYIDMEKELPELLVKASEKPEMIDVKKFMYNTPFDMDVVGQ